MMYTPRFFPDPRAGGRTVSISNLARALSEKGFSVHIYSFWQGEIDGYSMDGVEVLRIAKLYNRRILDYVFSPLREFRASRILRKSIGRYDIVHVFGPTYGFRIPPKRPVKTYRGWQKVFGRIPLVYHFRGSLEPHEELQFRGYRIFLKNALEEASTSDIILTLTRKTLEVYREYFPEKRVEIVPNFVSDVFAKHYDEMDEYPEKFTVLYVGGTLEYKGYRDVLRLKRLFEGRGDVRFVIMGPNIKKVPHEKMPEVYMSSSVLLFPSKREGLPPAVMEAQALKRPVIATNVGGIPDIVVHGKTGFLVRPGDVEAMARYIVYLKDNPSLLRKMGDEARRHVLEKFSKENVLNRLVKIYNSLL